MRKHVLLFIMIAHAFTFGSFAQQSNRFLVNAKAENLQLLSDRMAKNEFVIVSYYVEEKINMKFGATTTTYTVPTLEMVNTNDLGDDNKRTIIPKYVRAKVTVLNSALPKASFTSQTVTTVTANVVIPKEKKTGVSINILRTYERVLEKGYCTVDMLLRVANWRYFEGDLEEAARWYSELYFMTTDLDVTFYYRYAESLKFIGQPEKAKEIMMIYESKSN